MPALRCRKSMPRLRTRSTWRGRPRASRGLQARTPMAIRGARRVALAPMRLRQLALILTRRPNPGPPGPSPPAAEARRNALPRVTGVRHWSTPDYTRVAIDIEQEVKFDSQRILRPDRIFFDLRDTKLASTLVGKTFDVDDGFLKKIRVAEFEPGRTRIVLEVDDLASYAAFLLPDPYRLIIDIHGKQKRGTLRAKADTSAVSSLDSDEDSSAARPSSTVAGDSKSSRVGQQESAVANKAGTNKKAATRSSKQGLVETDLPAQGASTDPTPADSAKPANGNGVIKTTVAVKGSNRRIPKTIVPADNDPESGSGSSETNSGNLANKVADNRVADDSQPHETKSATVAALDREKRRSELTASPDDDISGTDDVKPAKSASSSPIVSSPQSFYSQPARSSPTHSLQSPKKSRSAAPAAATDTADLQLDTPESREARPTADGDRSLTRALGLKIGKIVIDAGHGGP